MNNLGWPSVNFIKQMLRDFLMLNTIYGSLAFLTLAAFEAFGTQSHYIEVAQGDIFMEQKMCFGQVLGRLAILKKKSLGRL